MPSISLNSSSHVKEKKKTAEDNYIDWYSGYYSTMEITYPGLASIFKILPSGKHRNMAIGI